MPACPRDNQPSSLPPPGFTDDSLALKRVQLIELLEKIIKKCHHEPQFIGQQPKQTDLLVAIAQFTLLSTPVSPDDKRDFLNNILIISQDLLTDENHVSNEEITLSSDSNSSPNEDKVASLTILPSNTSNNDVDGDFSLEDLANEYLQNEPSPISSNDKPTPLSESGEPDLPRDDLSKVYLSSSPSTNILSKLFLAPLSNEPIATEPQLESILFSNRLSSHDAADDANCIWKEESSSFGQLFCTKTIEIPMIATKRISTCLFDHSLYERLTRLISLLPKQCLRNSVQQLSVRSNAQQYRPQRPNNDNRRPQHRPSFQQNSSQAYHMQRFPPGQNARQYTNSNYSNQQGNAGGYFVDRRSQPPPPPPPPPQQQHQQQNRYPQPLFPSYPDDHPHQQKGPPKHNPHGGGQQQKKKPAANNQQTSNQQQNQRGTNKGFGGNKLTNEKSGVPGSGPSLNPK